MGVGDMVVHLRIASRNIRAEIVRKNRWEVVVYMPYGGKMVFGYFDRVTFKRITIRGRQ